MGKQVNVWNGSAWVPATGTGTNTSISGSTPAAVSSTATAGSATTASASDHAHQGVASITGTTDQVTASTSTGAVTLSLPQSIATTSSPTFAEVTTTAAIRTATGNADPAVYIGDDALIFDTDTADALGIQGQQTAANGVIILGSGKDTNLYRGAANLLKTDDALYVAGHTYARYTNSGSVTDTTSVGTSFVDVPSHSVTFTPNYVGQRWLISLTAACVTNTSTVQYVIYSTNISGAVVFYTRTTNQGNGIAYSTNVSGSDVYTSVGTTSVTCQLAVRMQTSTGITVSTYYARLNAVPLP